MFALPAFGGGGGRILLDNVGCSGGEERLENCTNGGIGNNDCLHLEDAGVICSNGKVLYMCMCTVIVGIPETPPTLQKLKG